MKKICFITTVHGTLRSFVLVTAEYLYKSGDYDITFICNGDKEFIESLPEYIKFYNVPMKRGVNFEILTAVGQLVKIFKKENFDIIQYATPNAALYSSIASSIVKTKVRIYGQWGLRYITLNGLKKYIFKALEKLTCNLSSHILTTSHKNKEYGVQEKLYEQKKATVLGDGGATGIELGDFDIGNRENYNVFIRDKYKLGDSFIFGFVGRFSRDKGANELLNAVKDISKYKDIKLLCIGDIELSTEMDMNLYNWALESKNVIFLGRIENKSLPIYYSAIDCYVHPSYREGFSKVIQEAASMGCAIITTDIPGASEVMEKDKSCLLVPPSNTFKLKNAMLKLIDNNELRNNLQKNARIHAINNFERGNKLKIQKEFYDSF